MTYTEHFSLKSGFKKKVLTLNMISVLNRDLKKILLTQDFTLPGYQVYQLPSYQVTKLLSYQVTKLLSYQVTKLPSYRVFKFPGFQVA